MTSVGESNISSDVKIMRSPDFLLLVPIIIVGGGLRFWRLGAESFWMDEIFSMLSVEGSVLDVIKNSANDVHPPIYFLILKVWTFFFGASEIAARSLSGVASTLTIPVVFLIGRLIGGRVIGCAASLLMAFSFYQIYYAQEARPYALLVLLTSLSIYTFFLLMRQPDKKAKQAGYVIFTLALIYTHYFGLLVFGAQILCVGLGQFFNRNKTELIHWAKTLFLIGICYLPWVSIVFRQTSKVGAGFWTQTPTVTDIFTAFSMYMSIYLPPWGHEPKWESFEGVVWWGLGIGCVLYLLLRILNLKEENLKKLSAQELSVLSMLMIFPFGVAWLISQTELKIFSYRNASVITPVLVLFVAYIVGYLYSKLRIVAIILLCPWVGVSMINMNLYHSTVAKPQWRELVEYVDSTVAQTDGILFDQSIGQSLFDFYSEKNYISVGLVTQNIRPSRVLVVLFKITDQSHAERQLRNLAKQGYRAVQRKDFYRIILIDTVRKGL